MTNEFVQRLKTYLGKEGREEQTASTEESVSDGGQTSRLFACKDCNSTYIATDMESCPECGDELQVVPNEKDLGLV